MRTIARAMTRSASVITAANMAAPAPRVPDNGTGTANMPLHLDYIALIPIYIIDGLPAGTNVAMDAVETAPTSAVDETGGMLGSTQSAGVGSGLLWNMQGTGPVCWCCLFAPSGRHVPAKDQLVIPRCSKPVCIPWIRTWPRALAHA